LAGYFGLSVLQINQIKTYSTIHLNYQEVEDLVFDNETESKYELLQEKTLLGTRIAKRLQLAQKAEDIARAHIEGVATDAFFEQMRKIQPEIEAQVILLCDLYVTMRSSKSYKRPYPNQAVIQLFEKSFVRYFDYNLVERFLKFKAEFEKIYNDY
jgi:response regulator RpfG family c-di-GMP phosphodiesterase